MSSTSLAVINDSSSPTRATATAYGPISCSVCQVSGTCGTTESGQALGQRALVAHRRDVDPGQHRDQREEHDGHQRSRYDGGQPRQQHDDGHAHGHHRVDGPGHPDQVRHLAGEDQDRQRVDEADHDAARDEPHQPSHPEQAEHDLQQTAEQHRGDQVVDAVLAGDRGDHQGDRAGGGRDHRGTATDHGDGDRHRDRAEQTDPRVDPGDDRERDRLGDQGQRHHESGQHLGAQPTWVAEGTPDRGRGHRVRAAGEAECAGAGDEGVLDI